MKNIKGDLFEQLNSPDVDAVCITTNGFVKSNGSAVMGRGCAFTAKQRFPLLDVVLGRHLREKGNVVSKLMRIGKVELLAFPVKPDYIRFSDDHDVVAHMHNKFRHGDKVPGWACVADIDIIRQSAYELEEMATANNWNKVIIPRPGCGAGELDWNIVELVLQEILDDRFYAITF